MKKLEGKEAEILKGFTDEVVMIFELEIDYYQIAHIDKKFIQKQKDTMTKAIFQNDEIFKQVRNSASEDENDYPETEEEFIKFIEEASKRNNKYHL